VLPWQWFVVIAIYYPWCMIVMLNLHDQLFHGKFKIKDTKWLLPIYNSSAWHLEHHTRMNSDYDGTSPWYLLNPMWYFKKLFFKKR
jgi:sterol desaturase/sphingolipid hydroxylase (fatty acid hydroxylase superfamily)